MGNFAYARLLRIALPLGLSLGTSLSQAAPLFGDISGSAGFFPSAGDWQSAVTRAKDIGFHGSARFDLPWAGVEYNKGIYDFRPYDTMYSAVVASGLKMHFILDYNNDFYASPAGQVGITTAANRQAFANFAAAAAKHFAGKGITWEIWNEPDRSEFWTANPDPTAYAALVQAAVTAMRQVDPSTYIVNGGFGNENDHSAFIKAAMQAGMLNGLNAFAVHSYDAYNYAFPVETQETWHATFRSWMSQYNNGKVLPIIDTEFAAPPSWNVWPGSVVTDPVDYSAKVQIRMALNNYQDGVIQSHAFGMMANEAELNMSTDTPAVQAFRYVNQLIGSLSGTSLNLGTDARGILFINPNDSTAPQIMALWATGCPNNPKTPTVTLPSSTTVSGAYDVYGNQVLAASTVSTVALSEWKGPIFLVIPQAIALPANGIVPANSFETKTTGSASGTTGWGLWSNGKIEQAINIAPAGNYAISVNASGMSAAGVWPQMVVSVDGQQVGTFNVSSTSAADYALSSALSLAAGAHTFSIAFTNDARTSTEDRNLIVNSLKITFVPPTLTLPTSGFTNKPVGGAISGSTGWNIWSNGQISQSVNIASNGSYVITVNAAGMVAAGVWPQMQVLIDGQVAATFSVNSTTQLYYVVPSAVTLAAGAHTFAIGFTNDYRTTTEDRNLLTYWLKIAPK